MKMYNKNDIKTDDHLNLYGWEMRLLQVESDIANLENDKNMCKIRINELKEKCIELAEGEPK